MRRRSCAFIDWGFEGGAGLIPRADLSSGLRHLLDALDAAGRGRLVLYGGPYGIRSDTQRYVDPLAAGINDLQEMS